MRIRILDRYIFSEVFDTLLFAICAFTAVFVGSGTLFRIAQYITEYGASFSSVVKIFILSLPGIVVWTFPMSMLLSCLLAFGKLSGGSEITAMKSCGVSFFRIALPALILGVMVSVFSLWFNEYIVPWANTAYAHVVNYEIKNKTSPESQDHIIIKDIADGKMSRLIYARRYDADTDTMLGVTMQMFEDGKLTHVENAAYAEWKKDEWTMHDGIIYDVTEEKKKAAAHSVRFKTQTLPVHQSPSEIVRSQKKPEAMTIRELKAEIALLSSQYVSTVKLETELYQRFTIPFASFVFALVGTPLGLQPNRSSSSRGFVLSLTVIFVYYVFMTMSGAIAQGGVLPFALSMWIPNIIGTTAGLILMRVFAR